MDLMDPPSTIEAGAEQPAEYPPESVGRRRGRLGAGLEVASVLLLLASFRWAHHWGPVTDTIVALWAITWLTGLWYSARGLRWGGRTALTGLVIALVIGLLVAGTGIASAAGLNPVGSCGGG